jgi:nucleoside-diphosphate-sugar epimerase
MKNILITGGTGFLGSKIYNEYKPDNFVRSVGRSTINDIICDLRTNVPQFQNNIFDTVIHCAGVYVFKEVGHYCLE